MSPSQHHQKIARCLINECTMKLLEFLAELDHPAAGKTCDARKAIALRSVEARRNIGKSTMRKGTSGRIEP